VTPTGLGLALLPIARDIPEGLRELHRLPSAGWIGVHLVSREGLADTITRTAASMLSSFLTTTTEMARTRWSHPESRVSSKSPSKAAAQRSGAFASGSGRAAVQQG
jgi:hypothetical protein